jgi:hypothetical protein
MTPSDRVTVLHSLVSILFLWMLARWLVRDYRLDWFRQKVFTLRDSMFDEAAAGMIPFEHPAYGTLRTTMNGFIRFAHRLGLIRTTLLFASLRNEDMVALGEPTFSERWNAASRDLPPQVKQRLNQHLAELHLLVIAYMVPGIWTVAWCLVTLLPLVKSFRLAVARVATMVRVDRIDALAHSVGISA